MNYWQNKKTGAIISRESKYTLHPFFWVLIGSADTDTTDINDTNDTDNVDDTTIDTDTNTDNNTDDDSIISEILSTASENNQFEDYSDLVKNADKEKVAYIGDNEYEYVDSRWRKV